MSDEERQSVDEHMAKLKGRMWCKQYMKNKPTKWGFKWCCRYCSKTGYLYEFERYLGKKEKTELGLGETAVLDIFKKFENLYWKFYLIFSIFQLWWLSSLTREYATLVQLVLIEIAWLL